MTKILNFFSSSKYFKLISFLTFDLILLGAAVRIFDAGLACPDWPLCFDQVIPDYHPIVYLEFLHRALAGIVGLMYLFGFLALMVSKLVSAAHKWLCVFGAVVLVNQILLGALTVILNLNFSTVTLHLGLALVFLMILIWLGWSLQGAPSLKKWDISTPLRNWLIFCFVATFGQVLLGGAVASNYAGLVCVDFPLCHGAFAPTLKGIIGIQVMHRLGAYALFVLLFATAGYLYRLKKFGKWPAVLAFLISAQVLVGAANILMKLPAAISLLHLLLAALLLVVLLKMLASSTSGLKD